MADRIAGGHVDRGDGRGWVVDDSPAPPVSPPEPVKAGPAGLPGHPAVASMAGYTLPEPDPEPEPDQEPEPEENGPPPQNATKDAWVDWAISEGFDRDEAEAMTKQDLIDLSREEA
jgi:hypothetical protein